MSENFSSPEIEPIFIRWAEAMHESRRVLAAVERHESSAAIASVQDTFQSIAEKNRLDAAAAQECFGPLTKAELAVFARLTDTLYQAADAMARYDALVCPRPPGETWPSATLYEMAANFGSLRPGYKIPDCEP